MKVKEDLETWLSFLSNFNGRSFFLSSSKLNLFTDASGALGFSTIFGSHWCYGKWLPSWEHQNIAILEFYPEVLGNKQHKLCSVFPRASCQGLNFKISKLVYYGAL